MSKILPRPDVSQQPQPPQKEPSFELRCGGVRLTVQRVPAWLITVVTTTSVSGLTLWLQR
ncbi:hypothetical protein [Streptomyces sp. NPDC002402]